MVTVQSSEKRFDINKIVNNGWFILAGNFASFIGLIVSVIGKNIICQIIFTTISSLLGCSIAFYMFYRVFNLKRARRNIYKFNLAINQNTYKWLHSFYKDLQEYYSTLRRKDSVSKEWIHDKAVLLCNRTQQVFTAALATNSDVSVCIKFFETELLDSNLLYSKVYTFARSTSTQPERLNYDLNPLGVDRIIDNSDFKMIVSDKPPFQDIDHFACEDLDSYPTEYAQKYKEAFKNSHFNPPYKSAIVIPIRTKIDNVSKALDKQPLIKNNNYHIIGFLCIDSEEKFNASEDFRLTRFRNCVELAFAIGESLYPFFEEYLTKYLND